MSSPKRVTKIDPYPLGRASRDDMSPDATVSDVDDMPSVAGVTVRAGHSPESTKMLATRVTADRFIAEEKVKPRSKWRQVTQVMWGFTYGWGWTTDPRKGSTYYIREAVIGLIIAFAQVPESVAFAFMARIDPSVALHAAWIVGLISTIFGGRTGMISGATGAMAAVIGSFVDCSDTNVEDGGHCRFEDHGIEVLFFGVILAGLLIALFGIFRLAHLVQLIPTSVMIGFCNGLAIVIGLAQLHSFRHNHEWITGLELFWMILICLGAMIAMEFWPRIPRAGSFIPASLIAIIVGVFLEFCIVRLAFGYRTNTIRDVSPFSSDSRFPIPFMVDTKYNISSLTGADVSRIVSIGLKLAIVATLEELMTLEVINDLQQNRGLGDHMLFACGLSNVVAGFFGTMGGNAMIGLSVMNFRSGGRGKESGVVAGISVMLVVAALSDVLNYIPIAALTGIMLVVVIHAFKWFSIPMVAVSFVPRRMRNWHPWLHRKIKRWDAVVIILVTALTPMFDLFVAVFAGICLSSVVFAWESIRKFEIDVVLDADRQIKYYGVDGPLFYGSKQRFEAAFTPDTDPDHVVVILKGSSSLYDYSALASLNSIQQKYKHRNKVMEIKGLSDECVSMAVKANHLMQHLDVDLLEVDVPNVPLLYQAPTRDLQSANTPAPTHNI